MNLYKITWKPRTGLMGYHTYVTSHSPENAIRDVNRHAPFTCSECQTVFKVKFKTEIEYIGGLIDDESRRLISGGR